MMKLLIVLYGAAINPTEWSSSELTTVPRTEANPLKTGSLRTIDLISRPRSPDKGESKSLQSAMLGALRTKTVFHQKMENMRCQAQRSGVGKFGSKSGMKKAKGQLCLDSKVYEMRPAESLCYSWGKGDHLDADCSRNGSRR